MVVGPLKLWDILGCDFARKKPSPIQYTHSVITILVHMYQLGRNPVIIEFGIPAKCDDNIGNILSRQL